MCLICVILIQLDNIIIIMYETTFFVVIRYLNKKFNFASSTGKLDLTTVMLHYPWHNDVSAKYLISFYELLTCGAITYFLARIFF
uniref:Uncharacterized protein n=1 Tax=Trichogramma kaykai TaxID=54128 RepID=A0ABD2XA80_9HYME